MATTGRKFSDYYNELDTSVKKRYQEKLNRIRENFDDPYTFGPGPWYHRIHATYQVPRYLQLPHQYSQSLYQG